MASARLTGTNENISTYGDGTRDYSSLGTWESATDNDLVTAMISEVLECYADSASFDDVILFIGAIANSSFFRIVRPATGEGHNGTPNSGVVFNYTGGAAQVFSLNESNASIQDIVINFDTNNASSRSGILLAINASNVTIVGCIVNCTNVTGNAYGFIIQDTTATNYIINCVVYNCKTANYLTTSTGTVYWYNCTSVGAARGFHAFSGTVVAKNCLADGSSISDYSGTFAAASEANSSNDTSAPGGGSKKSQTFTFVDSGNNDYHLAPTDAGAFQRGLDLNGDAAFPFGDDLDSETILVWSIGADAQASFISSRRRGVGENVSTYGGGGRDYTSLATWEAATDNDLVTAKITEVLECYADSPSFADIVDMAGAVTNAFYHRIIRPAAGQGHDGTPNAGVVFATITNTTCIDLLENFASVQDIVASVSVNDIGAAHTFRILNADSCSFIGCISSECANAGAGSEQGFYIEGSDLSIIVNCLSFDSDNRGININSVGNTAYVYNCTSVNNVNGIVRTVGTAVVKNCLADGNTTADFVGTFDAASTNNASGDASAPGANPETLVVPSFVDPAMNDYHLSTADTDVFDEGLDLSADAVFPFMDDTDGAAISVWAAGFDSDPTQPPVGGVGVLPYAKTMPAGWLRR